MARGMKTIQAGETSVNDVESYRRLVELQKQIIELAQQNEYAKMACAQLRDRVAAEVFSRPRARKHSHQKAHEPLTELPVNLAKSNLMSLITKEQPIC